MALVRKTAISASIDTNLASGKPGKITPTDHREVAQGIINYIDNRILTNAQGSIFAGSYSFTTAANTPDYRFTVPLGTTVDDPDYIVVGCITSATASTNNCRYFHTIKNRGTTSFELLLRAINPAASNLTFEYLLFSKEEIQ